MDASEITVRLLVALALCGLIGGERFLAGKAAGVRTHILVGMGAALFTLVSGLAFHASASNADRIAAQVVTGIGFIGGGAILKENGAIKGLTTAAGLWAVAAIGMAAGAGLYWVAGIGTAVIMTTLVGLRRVEMYLPHAPKTGWSVEVELSTPAAIAPIREILAGSCRRSTLNTLQISMEGVHVACDVELARNTNITELSEHLRRTGAKTVVWRARESTSSEFGP